MDSMNIAVKNALKFISLIQNVCDEKRHLLEQKQTQEFSCFLSEWKKIQKSSAQQSTKNLEMTKMSAKEENKEDELLPEEEEALILADSLLEKARNIRSKSKVSLKKKLDGKKNYKLQIDASSSDASIISSSKLECLLRISSNDLKLNEKGVPRSKSSTLPTHQKTIVAPRSKSSIALCAAENAYKHPKTCLKKSSFAKVGESRAKDLEAVGILSLAPSVKKIQINQKYLKQRPKDEEKTCKVLCNNIPADSTQNVTVKCEAEPPTIKSFLQELKNKLDAQGSFISRSCIWYPFLTFKHQEYLLSKMQCKSFCNFHKAYQLIHKLQETMFWIELLCLIAKEILPHLLKFDGNDLNRKRLCSYFKSIFQKTSQRRPLLTQS